jgi:hypothetical protein
MTDLYDRMSRAFALQGGNLPETSDSEESENVEWGETALPPEQIIRLLFTGFELPLFAAALGKLHDGLPLPQVFSWQPGQPEEQSLQMLNPEELRNYRAFKQILEMGRKSSKYLQAMRELLVRYPESQEIGLLISQYLRIWHAEEHRPFVLGQLAANPDWRVLKYLFAGYLLLEGDMAQTRKQDFLDLMQGQLELDQHLQGAEANAWEVLAFYQSQATWFVFADLRFERALYALNVCQQLLNELYPEASERPPESAAILQAWFDAMNEKPETTAQVRAFLKPLLQSRIKSANNAK